MNPVGWSFSLTANAPGGDATVGNTGFHATGHLPCAVGISAPMGSGEAFAGSDAFWR